MKRRKSALLKHYEETLGNVPEAISVLFKYDPVALEGYTMMRKRIMGQAPDGALPLKIKELIFVLLDCVVGNLDGAKNHVRAAIRAGLSMEELVEALVQALMVTGIASWGMVGYKVVEFAESIIAERK